MVDYPRERSKRVLGMLTELKTAFRRMHIGRSGGYSSKIGRKVLRRAFYPLARKIIPSDNRKDVLARKTTPKGKSDYSSPSPFASSSTI